MWKKRFSTLTISILISVTSSARVDPPASLSQEKSVTRVDARPDQQAYMVWDAKCIQAVKVTAEAKVIAPMVDGKPIIDWTFFTGFKATVDEQCGHVVIVRRTIATPKPAQLVVPMLPSPTVNQFCNVDNQGSEWPIMKCDPIEPWECDQSGSWPFYLSLLSRCTHRI